MRRTAPLSVARAVRTMAAALPVALMLCIGGCGPEPTSTYDDAVQAYDAKRYAESLRMATSAQAASTDLAQRQNAAFVAGMSAYKLNRIDDARSSFTIAAKSADRTVAGRSLAMQGAIAVEQKRWSDAERAYSAAAEQLTGGEAIKAREQAADAREMMAGARRTAAAPTTPAPAAAGKAANTAKGASPAAAPNPTGAAKGQSGAASDVWTVIAGTFSSETAARQRATGLADDAKRAGLGVPRVVPFGSAGRRLWQVEVGNFDTRAKAEAARKKVPVVDAAVAPSKRG